MGLHHEYVIKSASAQADFPFCERKPQGKAAAALRVDAVERVSDPGYSKLLGHRASNPVVADGVADHDLSSARQAAALAPKSPAVSTAGPLIARLLVPERQRQSGDGIGIDR